MAVGIRLKELREQRNLSMRQFAELMETHKKTVYTWEHDWFIPGTSNLMRISEFYGVSADYILYGIVTEDNEIEKTLNKHSRTKQVMEQFRKLSKEQHEQAIGFLEVCTSMSAKKTAGG